MADVNEKWPKNVPGKFFVDQSCIACDACVLTAPDNFTMDEDEGHAFVTKQPESPEEIELCVEAIGRLPCGSHRRFWRQGLFPRLERVIRVLNFR